MLIDHFCQALDWHENQEFIHSLGVGDYGFTLEARGGVHTALKDIVLSLKTQAF